ncbi:MAG: DNA cytosine methyltransferase [Sinimarinibacterium flocculans]|uniref:DNA cytosine methyltransferase n=1 Tax=Sinimarinibacterium flocculans TaxID=985250 RepID=UPI003C4331B8
MADGGIILQGKTRTIRAADLFCGAGGTSTGAARAVRELGGRLQLVAVNHWPVAIETHTRMHPEATHLCADLEHVRPRQAVPGGVLDLLMASPTCTYHSRARGGRPVHDQQRMDPWHVVRWCSDLRVHRLLVENVPEMVAWGPCDARTGRPIKSREGEYFRAWLDALRGIGFRLDWAVLNCANYGDATTRQRFFLIGRSDRKRLRWPEPTHARGGSTDLLGTRAPWRSAAEIIDWTLRGKSIFNRKRPLKPNTLRRILAGARRYHWPAPYIHALQALLDGTEPRLDITAEEAAPFLVHLRGTSAAHLGAAAHGVNQPVGTITARGTHIGLVMATGAGGAARATDQPIPTVTGGGEGGARPHFIEPLLMGVGSSNAAKPTSEPAPTITTGGASAEKRRGSARPQLIEPLLMSYYGSTASAGGIREPLDTVTTRDRFGLVQPILLRAGHGDDGHSAEGRVVDLGTPLPTVTGSNELGVAQPLIVTTSNSSAAGIPRSVLDPVRTITTAKGGDMAVAQPTADGYRIDILYRMLHWRELARAMSFDDDGEQYDFAGTATDIVKQIGNAVPGRTALALIRALLEG